MIKGVQLKCCIIILAFGTITLMNKWTNLPKEVFQSENVSYEDIMSKLNKDKVDYDNKTLLNTIEKHYIQYPSTLPYNLSQPRKKNQSPGQTQFIDIYLKQKSNGFFVDCGAYNGEHLSNSLFLERYRNWNGILIEPNPEEFKTLYGKHRKAYSLNACLSTNKFPSLETFFVDDMPVLGKVVDVQNVDVKRSGTFIQIQCFPLYSILLAIGRLEVDYFSLDVEGAERGVLDTIPWGKVNIKTISIEHNKWRGGKKNLEKYMRTRGYINIKEIKIDVAPDLIFAKI